MPSCSIDEVRLLASRSLPLDKNKSFLSLLGRPRFLPHIFFYSSTTSFPSASSNASPTFLTNVDLISPLEHHARHLYDSNAW